MATDDPRISVRVPKELHDKLQAAKERDGLSVSLHVVAALRNYLESPQPILTTPARRDQFEATVQEEVKANLEHPEQTYSSDAPEQLYRCPVHHDSLRPSPAGRCFCNRKTSEAV